MFFEYVVQQPMIYTYIMFQRASWDIPSFEIECCAHIKIKGFKYVQNWSNWKYDISSNSQDERN